MTDTYPTPAEGWTCFHCGEHFSSHGAGIIRAKEHFGDYPSATTVCQLWGRHTSAETALRKVVQAWRGAEKERDELRRQLNEDDTEKDREIHGLIAEHAVALMRAEEKGYEKGLVDAR